MATEREATRNRRKVRAHLTDLDRAAFSGHVAALQEIVAAVEPGAAVLERDSPLAENTTTKGRYGIAKCGYGWTLLAVSLDGYGAGNNITLR